MRARPEIMSYSAKELKETFGKKIDIKKKDLKDFILV